MSRVFNNLRFCAQSRGSALVETAIIAPVLLILAVCLLDLGLMLANHSRLTELVNEGLRLGSAIPELDNNLQLDVVCHMNDTHCGVSSLSGDNQLNPVAARIVRLVNLERISVQDGADKMLLSIKTGSALENHVTVELELVYRGLFSLFNGRRIAISARGPNLNA